MDLQAFLRGDNVIRLDGRAFGDTRTYRPARGPVFAVAALIFFVSMNVFPTFAEAAMIGLALTLLPLAIVGLFLLAKLRYDWIAVSHDELAWRDVFTVHAVPLPSIRWITLKMVRSGRNRRRVIEVEYLTPEGQSRSMRKATAFYGDEVLAQIADDIRANNPSVSVDMPLQELIAAVREKQGLGTADLQTPVAPQIVVSAPHVPAPQYRPQVPMAPPGIPNSIGGEDRRWVWLVLVLVAGAVGWWMVN